MFALGECREPPGDLAAVVHVTVGEGVRHRTGHSEPAHPAIVSEYVAESTVVAATGAAAGALVGTAVAAIPLIGSGRLTVSWLVLGLVVTATALLSARRSAIRVWWVTRWAAARRLL